MVKNNDLQEQSAGDGRSIDLERSPETQRQAHYTDRAAAVDALYNEPYLEEQDTEHGEPPMLGPLLDQDWREAFPQLVGIMAGQVESSRAEAKRKRGDGEGDEGEVTLPSDDIIEENVELQEHVSALLEEQDQDQGPTHASPHTSSPSPPQLATSPPAAHEETSPAPTLPTPASASPIKPRRQPRRTPVPVPPPPKPVKKPTTRSQTKATRPRPRKAEKQPRSPNSLLDDLDPKKKWCTCRCAERPALRQGKRRMIVCDAVPRCKVLWFHKKCVGLAEEDGEDEEVWYCGVHSGE